MMNEPFYKAVHLPTEAYWRPVTVPKIIDIDGNPNKPMQLQPGVHVELWTLQGQQWANEANQFIRNYGVPKDPEALEKFKEFYPGILPE